MGGGTVRANHEELARIILALTNPHTGQASVKVPQA